MASDIAKGMWTSKNSEAAFDSMRKQLLGTILALEPRHLLLGGCAHNLLNFMLLQP